MIRFTCACGKVLQVKDELAERRVRCPSCQAEQLVPSPESVIAEPTADEPSPVMESPRRRPRVTEEESEPIGPSGSSGKALASLIMGLLAFCTFIPGIIGIILGILALNDVSRSRGRLGGRGLAIAGLVLSSLGMIASMMLVPLLLLFPAVARVRTAAARTQDANNLKQIGLAMYNFHDSTGKLPSAAICDQNGKPLLSWRVAILPYIEQQSLYQQFKLDEPWDGPHNKALLAQMPKIYQVPGDTSSAPDQTHYRVFYGRGAAFELNRGLRLTEIPDGTSNTIMVMETAESVPWTKPDEIAFDPNGPLPTPLNQFSGKSNVLLMDGSVRPMLGTLSQGTFKALITRNGAEMIPPDW